MAKSCIGCFTIGLEILAKRLTSFLLKSHLSYICSTCLFRKHTGEKFSLCDQSAVRRVLRVSLLLLFFIGLCAQLLAQNEAKSPKEGVEAEASAQEEEKAEPTLPGFQNVRYDEDWSVLRDSQRASTYRKVKFIPLSEDGDFYFGVGGQLRLRGEAWKNFGFGGSGNRADTFGLFRLRLHGDLWLGPHVRFFVEGKSSLSTVRDLPGGLRPLDVDTIDLQNVILDLNGSIDHTDFTFRGGRQELQFGKQRLVSPLDWANTRRTFDGVRGIAQHGSWRIDGFWSEPVRVEKYSFNSPGQSDTKFFGVFGSNQLQGSGLTVDAYWFGYQADQRTWGGVSAPEDRHTIGGRLGGKIGQSNADFDFEAAYQFGDHGVRSISASMVGSYLGYTFPTKASPRVFTGFDFGSGDSDPDDGRVGTSNQLFPLGHAYLGYADVVGRQNIIDWSLGLSFQPLPKLRINLAGHNFWRAKATDALYNPGGAIVRPGDAGESRRVGFEFDVTAAVPINRHLVFSGGYSHFAPGEFIKESGTSEAINFGFIAIQTTF